MKIFVALFAALVMFGAMGAGNVLAHENGAFADATVADDVNLTPHPRPVGRNLLNLAFPGRDGLPGGPFDDEGSTPAMAVFGITKNPLCPLHWNSDANPDH